MPRARAGREASHAEHEVYLVVEGPQDVELVYRLLKPFNMERVRLEADLDPFFVPLGPGTYPPNGDLLGRVPVPLFLGSSTHVVAVHSAIGDTRLVQTVEEKTIPIDVNRLTGIGIVLDAGNQQVSG